MRSFSLAGLFAGLVSMTAAAGCDATIAEGVDALAVDAGTDAGADGGADGGADAAVEAPARAQAASPAAPSIASEPREPEQLGALTELSGRLGMVMDLGEGHAVGPIVRLSARSSDDVVLRRAHAPSEDEQALIGAPVALYQADGLVCRATIERLVEVASVVPAGGSHHGDRALWRIADEKNGITVIAELDAPGCDQPIFVEQGEIARAAAQPRRVAQGSAAETEAIERLKALPRFAAAQAAYRASADADPAITDWSDLADASFAVTEISLAGARYLTAEISLEGDCGAFGASVFAIWQRTGDGLRLVLDSDVAPAGYDLALDDDHDGVPELAAIAGEIEPVEEAPVFEGCGC